MRLTSSVLMACAGLLVVGTTPMRAAPPKDRDVSTTELLAAKQGSVIDATTSQPISDAFVIINWVTNSNGVPDVVGPGQWCDLQQITTTNADGRYAFGAVNDKLDMSDAGTFVNKLPWGSATTVHEKSYRVFVYKRGYALVGDEERVRAAAKYGRGMEWDSVPEITSTSNPIVLAPIRLMPTTLDAEGQWVYAAQLGSAAGCRDRAAGPNDAPRWHEFYEQLRNGIASLPCKMPSDALIAHPSLNLLGGLIADKRFEAGLVTETGTDVSATSVAITAGQVCRATAKMTGGQ